MSERNEILEQLAAPLDPTRVASRQGAGGRSLSYLEAYDVINRLNAIFGFDGWRDNLVSFAAVGDAAQPTLFRATVEIEARFGNEWVKHSDIGVGVVNGQDWKQENVEKAVKEAVSDAMKRAARKFGDQFGNCLYDKHAPEHGGGQQRPQQAQAPRQQQQARNGAPAAQNGHGGDTACPKCGGAMWDNRGRKKNPKEPDFRCKNKEVCDGVIWPPREGNGQRPARPAQPEPEEAPRSYQQAFDEDEMNYAAETTNGAWG